IGNRANVILVHCDLVADLPAVDLIAGGDGSFEPINGGLRAIMVHPGCGDDLSGAFTDPERAFGIGAVGGEIDEAMIGLKVVADFDPDLDGLGGGGIGRVHLRGGTAAKDSDGIYRVMVNPGSSGGQDVRSIAAAVD